MQMNKRILQATILTLAVLFALSTQVSAQGLKIGFVRDDVIKSNYKAWQRAEEQLRIEQQAWEEEAQTKEQELRDLLSEYDKQKLILSEEKRKEKEAKIMTKQEALDAFTRQIYSPGGRAEKKQEELILPLLENVTKAIEQVALDNNYDVIFTMQSGLGYIKETYDVTEQVLEKLETIQE